MSNELSLVLEDGIALQTERGMARLFMGGHIVAIDQGALGHLAEWLAVAWENVAGEEYKPVIISERGYVADPGVIAFESEDDERVFLEGLGHYDDGNGLERDCE